MLLGCHSWFHSFLEILSKSCTFSDEVKSNELFCLLIFNPLQNVVKDCLPFRFNQLLSVLDNNDNFSPLIVDHFSQIKESNLISYDQLFSKVLYSYSKWKLSD